MICSPDCLASEMFAVLRMSDCSVADEAGGEQCWLCVLVYGSRHTLSIFYTVLSGCCIIQFAGACHRLYRFKIMHFTCDVGRHMIMHVFGSRYIHWRTHSPLTVDFNSRDNWIITCIDVFDVHLPPWSAPHSPLCVTAVPPRNNMKMHQRFECDRYRLRVAAEEDESM